MEWTTHEQFVAELEQVFQANQWKKYPDEWYHYWTSGTNKVMVSKRQFYVKIVDKKEYCFVSSIQPGEYSGKFWHGEGSSALNSVPQNVWISMVHARVKSISPKKE